MRRPFGRPARRPVRPVTAGPVRALRTRRAGDGRTGHPGRPGQACDALRCGEELGAATDLLDRVWDAPSVCPPGEKPFFLVADRGIPGMVIVNGAGERYANEALPYHAFVDRMYAADRPGARTVPSWLVLDARSKARYLFAGLFPGQPLPPLQRARRAGRGRGLRTGTAGCSARTAGRSPGSTPAATARRR
ncbi:FAD-binding protein [Streptomyces sp. NC-S4]